jgi:hypothetical protein
LDLWAKYYNVGFDLAINFVEQLLLKCEWEVFTQVCGQTVTEVSLEFS